MTPQSPLAQAISERLEKLRARIKASLPLTICETGSLNVDASLEFYASFLKDPSAETIDLVVLIEPAGESERITVDVVQGGTGIVLNETRLQSAPKALPVATRRILKFIDDQEPIIVRALTEADAANGGRE